MRDLLHPTRVSMPKSEVHLSLSERETVFNFWPSQHASSAFLCQNARLALRSKVCSNVIFIFQHLKQPPKAKKSAELESHHPHDFGVGSSDTHTTDLRDYWTKKQCPSYHFSMLLWAIHHGSILQVLLNSHTSKLSVFNRLSVTPPSNSVKRCHSPARRDHFLTWSALTWLPTWWVQAIHQVSRKGSSWPSILGSPMLNFLQVWKKYWSNLK